MDPEALPWRREITTISFDVDGTLVDFDAAMRASLAWVLEEIQRVVPGAPGWLTVPALVEIRELVAAEHPGARHEHVRRLGFARALEMIGYPDPDLAARLSNGYLRRRHTLMRPLPGAREALTTLGRRFSMGVISNGNSDPRGAGLDFPWRFLVYSEDHGICKPDPRLFRIALRQAGCAPHECLHVGDSLATDIAGARAAGLRAAWLCGDDAICQTGPAPDVTIRCLTDLVDLLSGDA